MRVAFLTPFVVRFSRVALIAIAVVAATGTGNSLFNVESFGDLTSSGYGGLLLFKLFVFFGVLALGAINHFYVRNRLERAAREGTETSTRMLFKKTIVVELALALCIFTVTSALVGAARTRPSAAARGPVSASY